MMTNNQASKASFESFLRKTFKVPLDRLASYLLKIGLQPNHVTLFALLGNLAASLLIGMGHLFWGGMVAALMAPLDAVDGSMARQRQESSKFGAFFDSVVDRYDELVLLAGLLFYFSQEGAQAGVMLTYLATMGSVLVSYTRARAESLGLNAKTGILSRIERAIVLIIGLLIGKPLYSVGIIAVLGNITAIQRIAQVWKQSKTD